MVLAGIDEAGYGPILGPLVVGASAWRAQTSPEHPDLWRELRPAVCRERDRGRRRIWIADSKAVHQSGGIADLERAVLSICRLTDASHACLDGLIRALDPRGQADLAQHPWYGPGQDEAFPLATSPSAIGPDANSLRAAAVAAGLEPLSLSARIVPEARYNRLVAATRNKSSALFSIFAQVLDPLMQHYAHSPGGLLVICDRQGGRERYAEPLRTMFPDWSLAIEHESPQRSDYSLTCPRGQVRLSFREQAESQSLATALASMLCKYLREALMARFNRWWHRHAPSVRPTAGYYSDGTRFLGEIAEARARLRIPDPELIRSR